MSQNSPRPIEFRFKRVTRYHYYCFGLISLAKIPTFWHIMSLIFLSPPMSYSCNSTSEFKDTCPCDNPIWDKSVFTKTMQTKYNIVCDRVWLVSFSQSMLYVGTLIGSFTFGFMSDRYGRLSMYTASSLCLAVAGCLVSLMPNATSYIIMRCIEGIGLGGAIVTGYVLLIEYCGPTFRETVTALYHLPLNIGQITLSGLSYLMRDCDVFQVVLSLPIFACLMLWCLLHESPKWLMDNNQVNKALEVLQKIAKFNGVESCNDIEFETSKNDTNGTTSAESAKTKIVFLQIFKDKTLTLNLLCMSFVYFVCGMGYYGVSLYIGKMSGDIHLNVAIAGLINVPGTLSTVIFLKFLSRRIFLMATNLLSGFFMISVICIPPDYKFLRMIFASIGNTFFFMSFITIFLYSVEIFPTQVRNSVLGVMSMLSRIGQIIAPPVNALNAMAAGAIFGVLAIVGAALCYPLPETKNKKLPSTFEESRALKRPSRQSTNTR